MASDYVPVKTTDTEINEKTSAAFLEYGRSFGKVYAQVGLRYEHLTNDYFNFGKKEDEVCRDYGDWFPTAARHKSRSLTVVTSSVLTMLI